MSYHVICLDVISEELRQSFRDALLLHLLDGVARHHLHIPHSTFGRNTCLSLYVGKLRDRTFESYVGLLLTVILKSLGGILTMKDQHLPKPMLLTVLDDALDVLPKYM